MSNQDVGTGSAPPQPGGDIQAPQGNPWSYPRGWWPTRTLAQLAPAAVPYMPSSQARPMSQLGTPDATLQGAQNYPGWSPALGMPQGADFPALINRLTRGFGQYGSPGVAMSAIGAGNAANNYWKSYYEGAKARQDLDYGKLRQIQAQQTIHYNQWKQSTEETINRENEELRHLNELIGLYGYDEANKDPAQAKKNADAVHQALSNMAATDPILKNYLDNGGPETAQALIHFRDGLAQDASKMLSQALAAERLHQQQEKDRETRKRIDDEKKLHLPPESTDDSGASTSGATAPESSAPQGPTGTGSDTGSDSDFKAPAPIDVPPLDGGDDTGGQAQPGQGQPVPPQPTQTGQLQPGQGEPQQPVRVAEAATPGVATDAPPPEATGQPVQLPQLTIRPPGVEPAPPTKPGEFTQGGAKTGPAATGPVTETGPRVGGTTQPAQLPLEKLPPLTTYTTNPRPTLYRHMPDRGPQPPLKPIHIDPAPDLRSMGYGLSPADIDQRARRQLRLPRNQMRESGPAAGTGYIVNSVVNQRVDHIGEYTDRVLNQVEHLRQIGRVDPATGQLYEQDYKVIESELQEADPDIAAMFRSVRKGQVPLPLTGYAANSPFWNVVRGIVLRGDPSFSPVRYEQFRRTTFAFASGANTYVSQVELATDRALQHMRLYIDLSRRMRQMNIPLANTPKNWLLRMTGDPTVATWGEARLHLQQELVRVFRGTGGSVSDINHELDIIDSSSSFAQMSGVVKTQAILLMGQMNALAHMWNLGVNARKGDPNYKTGRDLLSDQGKEALDYIFGNNPDGTPRFPGSPDANEAYRIGNMDYGTTVQLDDPDPASPIIEGRGKPVDVPKQFLSDQYYQQWQQGHGEPVGAGP